ncbi:MAG TPA: SpoIIE family protein phosphatase [Bacteroidia bacterium]|nr:SpoIIE family protein phosphatase [Bacteroidia bacterium]HRD38730.1 SpoIIE family protein phosphatase [Bacteroidia bacterium]
MLKKANYKQKNIAPDSELQFKKLVESAKEIIYATDNLGNISYVNDSTLESLGYTKEELIGKSYKTLIREDYVLKTEAFYKKQIKDNVGESFQILPFVTKSGKLLWVGQSAYLKFETSTGKYTGSQIICRNITERILAEEKLKQHNSDLKVINRVKEIILASNETSNMYVKILLLLGANSDKTNLFSINIIDKYDPRLHNYSLNTKDQSVQNTQHTVTREDIERLYNFTSSIINFDTHKKEEETLQLLHQHTNLFKSAVISSIESANKIYGFVCFFSKINNIYQEDHVIMVKDICTSLSSFFVQYDQRQLINDYSKQLEILNASKTKLISYNNLTDVYNGIIELLYQEIKNVYRVSVLIHDLDKKIGNLIYKDNKSPVISSKIINTTNVPTVPLHVKGQIFDKQDLNNDPHLSDEDKLWLSRGINSIISLPIMIGDKLYASVNLLSTQPHNFTEQQKALIKEINESAAIVIEQLMFKEIISEKNKDISDNINYAKRIQNALMPAEDYLNKLLPESFLIFSQRDSLGGDFYWYDQLEDNIFMAVGDCTGHGVSGSLLTILASDYLKQAIEVKKFTDPGLVLEQLRDSMHATLNKYNSGDEIMDGLDISLGVYNIKTKTFMYASAMQYFYLVRNNELMEYKGNRKPIGGTAAMESSYYFTTHLFQLMEGDMIYFTTDGYIDQLQQTSEKRFGKARFKQLLLLISDLPTNEQKKNLLEQHTKWKGNLPQTDDICLLGFRV